MKNTPIGNFSSPASSGAVDTIDSSLRHSPFFGGNIYYVSSTAGDDSNDGKSPCSQFATIGKAMLMLIEGDAINIMAGTYSGVGLDLNVNACELWFEIGAVIAPASGTALTISGANCLSKGMHVISPAAGEIGLLISGANCHVEHGKVQMGGTGLKITGIGCMVNNWACGNQTIVAYDIQGGQARLTSCNTVGAGSTYGYKINGGSDTGVLNMCTSVGHSTSGFFIDTGSQDWTIINCSSGAGDGRWANGDNANVFSGFTYADEVNNDSNFTAGITTYNLFKVTGAVRIDDIIGHIETIIPAVASTVYLQLYSTNGTVDLTDAPGVNISGAVVGALLVRNAPSDVALDLGNPDTTPAIVENVSVREPKISIDILADDSADTYIRLVMSVAQASGEIHWHCHWSPLTEEGFLEVV